MNLFKGGKAIIEQQYYAFISYKRDGLDKKWAKLIYKQLTNYNLNVYFKDIEDSIVEHEKINVNDKTIKPIFKDTEQLVAGGDLNEKIKQALRNSRKLIVVCSRNMKAHEYWINLEVKYFISLGHGPEDILPIIIESEIENSSPEKCFPTDLPTNWHAISVLDHKLTEEDGYIARLVMSVGSNKYRKTILSLIPNLFPTVKRSLEELWEIDKRQKITKWLLSIIFMVIFVAILCVLLLLLHNARTRAYEGLSMRLVEEAQIECRMKNMQRAALLLQQVKEIKDELFVGDFSPFVDDYITRGINDFYNAADTVREYVVTPSILAQSNNKKVLAGFKPDGNIIYIWDTTTLGIIDTIRVESNIMHMSISRSGKYIFVLGINDCCVVDFESKRVIFKKSNVKLGQGHRTNYSPFSSTIHPYSFSEDERFLYYISDSFYAIELSSGKEKKIPFKFHWGSPFLFTNIQDENKIMFVASNSAFIIDVDNNRVDSLRSAGRHQIWKAGLSEEYLYLIQNNNSGTEESRKYDINVIDIKKDKLIHHFERTLKFREGKQVTAFNACWMNNQLAVVDSNKICLYDLKRNSCDTINRESYSKLYNVYSIDKDRLMLWDKQGVHFYSIQDGKEIESIPLYAIDGMPLFDRFFIDSNYVFHTSYYNGSVIYRRNIINNTRQGLNGLTGIAYSATKKYIMMVYNFKHIKIVNAKTKGLIKEFDSPIFIEGSPQVIDGRHEFVMRCQTDFVIYDPEEDYLWSLPEWSMYSSKYDRIEIKVDNYGPTTSFYNNGKRYCSNSARPVMNYPLLVPDEKNCVEINNFKINIQDRTYESIAGEKIEGSSYYFTEKENVYTFLNTLTNDTFSLKLNIEHKGEAFCGYRFIFNDPDRLLFVVTGCHGVWKNYIYSYSGELLKTCDYISPSVCPIDGGFLVGDLTRHGLFVVVPDKETENICNVDAFACVLYTPDKKNIFLSGSSGNNYLFSSTGDKRNHKLPILGIIYNSELENLEFSKDSRCLFLEDVPLKAKDGTYNIVNCVMDLNENKILIYWYSQLFAPCTFTFFDDNTFFYVDYNKDGTVKRCVQGELNEDFFFDWIRQYSQRKISSEELAEYGL